MRPMGYPLIYRGRSSSGSPSHSSGGRVRRVSMWPRPRPYSCTRSGGKENLFESQVQKDAPGAHGIDVSGPKAVGVVVGYQLVGQAEDPTYRGGELEVFGIEINSKPQFITIAVGLHTELPTGIVVQIVLLAAQVGGRIDPGGDKGLPVSDPSGAGLDQQWEADVSGFDLTNGIGLGGVSRKTQGPSRIEQAGLGAQVQEFVDAEFPDQAHIEPIGFVHQDILSYIVPVFKLEVELVHPQIIPPVQQLFVLVLEVENGIAPELGMGPLPGHKEQPKEEQEDFSGVVSWRHIWWLLPGSGVCSLLL